MDIKLGSTNLNVKENTYTTPDFRRRSHLRRHVFLMKGVHIEFKQLSPWHPVPVVVVVVQLKPKLLQLQRPFEEQKLIRCWWKVWGVRMKLSLLPLKSQMSGIQIEVGLKARRLLYLIINRQTILCCSSRSRREEFHLKCVLSSLTFCRGTWVAEGDQVYPCPFPCTN